MNQKKGHILFLIVICYFSFFINNQLIFADIMESRNLVTAREITEEGNWLVPTMNGELRLESRLYPLGWLLVLSLFLRIIFLYREQLPE